MADLKPTVSDRALRVLDVLRAHRADHPERAIPDGTIAREARVPVREVIELTESLVGIDVAVLATCGKRGEACKGSRSRTGKGRFICGHAGMVRSYSEKLHRRAKAIHGRAKSYRDLAERMDARRSPDTTGQLRTNELFEGGAMRTRSALGAFA